jgi:hypothetical protein
MEGVSLLEILIWVIFSIIVPSNVCTKISHQRGRDCDYDEHNISVISCNADIKERITRKTVMIVG